MTPAPHPNQTRAPGQPLNWDEDKHGPCAALSIADVEEHGLPFMESLWSLDSLERAALIAGEQIILRIQGHAHPVVRLGVTLPRPELKGTGCEKHNQLSSALTLRLLVETETEARAMVVLESVVLGVMLRYRPQAREAAEFLDLLTQRVIDRMAG
jgi:hypothetical protein